MIMEEPTHLKWIEYIFTDLLTVNNLDLKGSIFIFNSLGEF